MYRMLLYLLGLYIMHLPGASFAQQPGSAAYNSVYLPAHGIVDTRRPALSWGSFAGSDENGKSGWGLNASSEAEARSAAIEQCTGRGGINCAVVVIFANSCAAVANGDTRSFTASGESLTVVRRKALRGCGKGCAIFQERCSMPSR